MYSDSLSLSAIKKKNRKKNTTKVKKNAEISKQWTKSLVWVLVTNTQVLSVQNALLTMLCLNMFWSTPCISASGVWDLVKIEGIMNILN